MEQIIEIVGKFGGLVVLAGLFVWVFVQDRNKNTKLLEELTKTNADNSRAIDALVESNRNIATSLEIIKSSLVELDTKADRNYEKLIEKKGSKQ